MLSDNFYPIIILIPNPANRGNGPGNMPVGRGINMKLRNVILAGAIATASYLLLERIGRRSGVTEADIIRRLPGDDLVQQPVLLADRSTIIEAPVEQIWPWLVQLGKERGGWYFPSAIERFLPQTARGAQSILLQFQSLAVGDVVPDYGPGSGTFKVIALEAPHVLVYYSVRQPSAGWTWPEVDDPLPAGVLVLSWALILDELDEGQSNLHIRLRANPPGGRMSPLMLLLGGFFDYLTIVLLFRGLKERLSSPVTEHAPGAPEEA